MLCETAIWDRRQHTCNWMSASPVPGDSSLSPLGFDLYDGLAGVALFLAAARLAFGSEKYGETCVAALRSAHLQAQSLSPSSFDLSIFEGRFGLHFTTGLISRMLNVPASAGALAEVARLLADVTGKPHSLDVMGGSAGAICGLLSFEPHHFQSHLSAFASQLGDDILMRASLVNGQFVWLPTDANGAVNGSIPLCGLSHGASGIAATLLRLFQRSGRSEFLSGARAAFAYEDRTFDPQLGSWPDYRAQDPYGGASPFRSFDAWCHGAGGIALARMQAVRSDIQLQDHHRAVAKTAVHRTHFALCSALDSFERDDSLCHGVLGLAEICRIGGAFLALPEASSRAGHAALAVAQRVNALEDIAEWPADLLMKPGLMLGASGIGYSLLGFAGVQLPSVLTLFEPLV